ncbi:MAG: hypothetical protein LBG87_05040 [Spirochaetaceae bacterium]|jgi:hypothetical protein|nr:hypothetical protein [Spirochaetaceae bacterium]
MKRYAEIQGKFPREIVLLKSTGCAWKGCTFCDYWTDAEPNPKLCARFNREILKQVKGSRGVLEAINSASFDEFPSETVSDLIGLCVRKRVKTFVTEQHYRYRASLPAIRDAFALSGTECMFILGLETFDGDLRERLFNKGMGTENILPDAAQYYQWINLLWGVEGQTLTGIQRDIETGLAFFERINVNIFIPNSTGFVRDQKLVDAFYASAFFAEIKDNPAVEILDVEDQRCPDHIGFIGYADA